MRMPKMAMMRMSKKMPGRVLIHKEGDRYHYQEPYRPPFKDPKPNAIPFPGQVRYDQLMDSFKQTYGPSF